jgi:opacity protein-like surface antigen
LGSAWCTAAFAAEPAAATSDAKAPAGAAAQPSPDAAEPAPAEPSKKTASELKASTSDKHSPPEDTGGKDHVDEQFGHGMQFGIRAGIVGGYRMIFRYDKSPFCHSRDVTKGGDKDQQKFCGNAAPAAVDLGLSFAVLDFAEPFLWARFGLGGEASTDTESLMAFGVGARIYTSSESKFKIFVEPAVGMETEGGGSDERQWFQDTATGVPLKPDYKTDFLFHLGVGPQYDFARAFGMYVNFGLTTGVLRYIHTEIEGSIGAQVRVP